MKRFIKSLFLYVPFSVGIYAILIVIWGNYAPDILKKNLNYPLGGYGHMYSRLHNIKDVRDVDILFLGSSHAYRGFDPRIFEQYGFNTLNLGSSAQSHLQTELLLKRYLDQINPKLIIYEVYAGTFSSDGVESSLDIIANDKNDFESIKMALTQNHIKVYNALIYGFYRDFLGKNDDYEEELVKGEDTYIEGGYVEKKLEYFEPVEFNENNWNLDGPQFRFFERALRFIQQRNIPVILVQAPITKSMYTSFLNNGEFDDKMKTYGAYYNFNELIELDDELHFYNSHHLNQTGVEIFNTKLIEILFDKRDITNTK
jgi:hypothetical protein